jgi:hypothetical protein
VTPFGSSRNPPEFHQHSIPFAQPRFPHPPFKAIPEHGVRHAWKFGKSLAKLKTGRNRERQWCAELDVSRPHGTGDAFIETAHPGR